MAITRAVLKVVAEATEKGFETLEGSLEGIAEKGKFAAGIMTGAVSAGMALFAASATQAASRAQETQNLFEVSFGDMAGRAEEWAMRTQDAVGINDTTLKEMSGTLFQLTSNMGITRDGAFAMATGFTQAALDASSFFNVGFDEALEKIRAGLSGSSQPLLEWGVDVRESTVLNTEFAKSILATGRELTQAEKVQARAQVILQGLSSSQDDLIRTQDSWANQTRIVGEAWVNLQETVGVWVANSPTLGRALGIVTDFLNMMSEGAAGANSNAETLANQGFFFMAEAASQTVKVVAFLIDALGALITGVGKVLEAFGNFGQFLLNNIPLAKALGLELNSFGQGALAAAEAVSGYGKSAQEAGSMLFDMGQRAHDAAANMEIGVDNLVNATGRQNEATSEASVTTETYAGLLDQLAGNMTTTSAATEGLATATNTLVAQLGVGGLNESAKQTEQALAALQARSEGLSEQGLAKVVQKVQELRLNGQPVPPLMAEIAKQMAVMEVNIERASQAIDTGAAAWDGYFENIETSIPPATAGIGDLTTETDESTSAVDLLSGGVGELQGLLSVIPGAADSAFGSIVGWLDQGISMFSSIIGLVEKFAGDLGGLGGLLGGLGGESETSGGGLGGLLGGLGNLIPGVGLAVAGVGALIGGIGGGRDSGTVMEEALRDMGAQIPEQLAQAIHDSGLNPQAFTAEIAQASGMSADRLAEEIGDIFAVLEVGKLTESEAQMALNNAIPLLVGSLDQLTAAGESQLARITNAAEIYGLSVDQLSSALAGGGAAGVPASNAAQSAAVLSDQARVAATGAPPPPPAPRGTPASGGAGSITVQLTVPQEYHIEGLFAGNMEEATRILGPVQERGIKDNPEIRSALVDLAKKVAQEVHGGGATSG